MCPALIRQFVHVVPICSLASPLEAILRQMEGQLDGKTLIVDHAQKPVGVIAFYDVLLGVTRGQTAPMLGQPCPQAKLSAVCSVLSNNNLAAMVEAQLPGIMYQSLHECLDSMASIMGRSLMQPVERVPEYWSLQEFRLEFIQTTYPKPLSLQTSNTDQDVEWVVIDRQGLGLGLLNQHQVWKTLALSPLGSESKPTNYKPTNYHWSSSSLPLITQSHDISNSRLTSNRLAIKEIQQSSSEWAMSRTDLDILWSTFVHRLTEAQARVERLEMTVAELKVQSATKDDLLAYISHELKTPLTAIVGLSELLAQRHSLPPDRYQYYAHLIYESSRQMMLLMTGLLDLIHLETAQIVLSIQSIALVPLCAKVYNHVQENQNSLAINVPIQGTVSSQKSKSTIVGSPNHQGPLSIIIEPGLENVLADESCLKQLLVNLFTNALVLSDPSQGIDLTITVAEQQDPQLWIAMKVTHIGEVMEVEQHSQIFQQLDLLREGKLAPLKGLGLRFMLALRLAEQQGGTLTFLTHNVCSHNETLDRPFNKNYGRMEVTALLPVALPKDSQVSSKKVSYPETYQNTFVSCLHPRSTLLQKKTFIVVVDNTPNHLVQLSEILSELGYSVVVARSHTEALDKVRCLNPIAVILNPALSHQTELALLKRLKQNEHTQAIPIIATTTILPSTHDHHHIDGYLQFPIRAPAIRQLLITLTKETTPSSPETNLSPITVLYFDALLWLQAQNIDKDTHTPNANGIDLNTILHPYHCRVIEVDSPEQAELLAKVWHPDVIVFGSEQAKVTPQQYSYLESCFRTFQQCSELAQLPIVTLSTDSTELAYHLGLHVFPCLEPLASIPGDDSQPSPALALIQVVRIAAASSPQSRPGN